MSSSPIADLSYRNYDGPLEPINHRWWSIAKSTMRLGFTNRFTWFFSFASGWYFYAMIFFIFIVDKVVESQPNPDAATAITSFFGSVRWNDKFLHGFQYGQFFYFVVAAILGSGAIANDVRANALLVYLSKPISKRDYVIGKWFGVFLPLLVIMGAPFLLFYLYGAMSFRDKGFISQDPWLFFRMLGLVTFCAGFYASLAMGISSMFSQGRSAGAVFAGLYFLTNFFTVPMSFGYMAMTGQQGRGRHRQEVAQSGLDALTYLSHASLDGINSALAKSVLGNPTTFPLAGNARGPVAGVPAPTIWFGLGIGLALVALCLYMAWRRVRAVDIVG